MFFTAYVLFMVMMFLFMSTLSMDFKKKVAELYTKNSEKIESFDPEAMESFASKMLQIIEDEKPKRDSLHDIDILKFNIGLLKKYSSSLKKYKPDTDECDFTRNDCTNIVDSTKKWLTLEHVI